MFVAHALDEVNEADFRVVIFEKNPVPMVNNAVKRGSISMVLFADPRILGEEPTKTVQLRNELISARRPESCFYVFCNPIRVFYEAFGV